MRSANLSGDRARLTVRDRLLAWLVTGPLARAASFLIDLAVLVRYTLGRRGPPEPTLSSAPPAAAGASEASSPPRSRGSSGR